MSERYVILTEKRKQHSGPSGAVYYSRAFGCFSRREDATQYESFEAAQPKVRELRVAAPEYFFNAVIGESK
jgi:hypothetical protein